MQISIISRCLFRNSLDSDLKVFKYLSVLEVWSLGLKSCSNWIMVILGHAETVAGP